MGDPFAEAPPPGEDAEVRAPGERPAVALESIRILSDHDILKVAGEDAGWRNEGAPSAAPEWTPAAARPTIHSIDEPVRLALALRMDGAAPAPVVLRGRGAAGLSFDALAPPAPAPGEPVFAPATSARPLDRRIRKLALDIDWAAADPAVRVAPPRTSIPIYVTAGRPREDAEARWPEDGVTLKRMERAVSWVAPLGTLDPHEILERLMERFPRYTLSPSPRVPKEYGHPQYFNREGGAWPMSDHVEESGECQAIARLFRGVFRQLGVPGDFTVLLVWADPRVGDGLVPIEVDWEQNPTAGLDATSWSRGRRCVAALVDSPVKEGAVYPPSHTKMRGGRVSPGLNRYEAFIRLTHDGRTRYYAPGAGVYEDGESRLRVFWGLVWVSKARGDGFRVEKIVTRY
ncbi:MAG: hypothetical protein IT372_32110 [Polyangiaceae bacterium]|nr:hypothetical protein [Polyangiaceae bacterium]